MAQQGDCTPPHLRASALATIVYTHPAAEEIYEGVRELACALIGRRAIKNERAFHFSK